jgi:diacylglycerol O-acyltransferase / wax synthase
MKPLSGVDNLFLQMEHGNQYMHVAGLGIYDQSTAPGGAVRFKQILDFFSRRVSSIKVFRRRLVVPPFNIDRPYWVEDAEMDVEYHVRHIALPAPGDWRQLMIQVARIHSRPLDRSKPLWEAYVIEGLDNIRDVAPNSFAFYIKFHHAAVDGEAGAQITKAIHSLTSELDGGPLVPSVVIADREPTKLELYARAAAHRGGQFLGAGRLMANLGARAGKAGLELAREGKLLEISNTFMRSGFPAPSEDSGFRKKPLTRFDASISPHRVVDAVGLSLSECKTIREHVPNVTINDIFLATCGGAVRRYLTAKNELPEQSLSALMPISTRGEVKDLDAGNQIGMVAVPLRSDIADPIERLRRVKQGSSEAKRASSVLGHDFSTKLLQLLPATASEALISKGLVSLCNTTVSNVRGPDVPLYLAGARLQVFLPVSAVTDGVGLNMTGFSYNGVLWVCFVACRHMLPDPKFFRQCLNESFAEILQAAQQQPTALETSAAASAEIKTTTKPRTPRKASGIKAVKKVASPTAKRPRKTTTTT